MNILATTVRGWSGGFYTHALILFNSRPPSLPPQRPPPQLPPLPMPPPPSLLGPFGPFRPFRLFEGSQVGWTR